MNDGMIIQKEERLLSVNEVACVAGVPLKQVYRIIRSDLLNDAVKRPEGGLAILSKALVGVKLAYETTEILTLEGRRRLICHLLYHPEADTVREGAVSVDIQPMKSAVQRRLTTLRCPHSPNRSLILRTRGSSGPSSSTCRAFSTSPVPR